MTIPNSKLMIELGERYTCGNCGCKFSATTENLEIEVPIETTPILGVHETLPSNNNQPIVRCPNCDCNLGRIKFR